MYHYVRPAVTGMPYFRYLHVEDFKKQVAFLAAQFGIVRPEAFLSHLAAGRLPERGIALTFDDGLKEHLHHAAFELERLGHRGLFFVNSGPFTSGEALDVHRIHHLVGQFGGEAVLQAVRTLIPAELVNSTDVTRSTYLHQVNRPATTEVKRFLNYAVNGNARPALLRRLEEELGADISWKSALYLSPDDVRELRKRGHYVGAHSVNHEVLSSLDRERQHIEVAQSFLQLGMDGIPRGSRMFCYPFGGASTFTELTIELLKEAGFDAAFCVKPEDIAPVPDPFRLPRYDCNMFPFGAASLGQQRAFGQTLPE